jgi:hypothetical protein
MWLINPVRLALYLFSTDTASRDSCSGGDPLWRCNHQRLGMACGEFGRAIWGCGQFGFWFLSRR